MSPFRERLYEIIFEADTPEGKLFDVALLGFILASVIVVMLESVPTFSDEYHKLFVILEWIFTIFFTLEYVTRLYTVRNPIGYALSFYGLVDLLSILPTYISLLFPGAQSLLVIRALRLLRVFRIFKLGNFMFETAFLKKALSESKDKIIVFISFILVVVIICGSLMYLIEGTITDGQSGFDSIPRSVYWAVVTLTTVGYGDISPVTWLGQFIAVLIMIMGYAIIAVPTGIITNEFTRAYKARYTKRGFSTQVCSNCLKEGHTEDAIYCKYCATELHPFKIEDQP